MNLKKLALECMLPEQLKELCVELEVDADRRSRDAMVTALAASRKAKVERLVEVLSASQLRDLLGEAGQSTRGKREELLQRVLETAGRAWPLPPPPVEVEAKFEAPQGGWPAVTTPRARVVRTGLESTEQYRHADEVVQRPDAGLQDQFQSKKAPKTYRYDSSLDPALSWDEQRERELGEWLLGLVVRAAKEGEATVFSAPQDWKGGGVRIRSMADAAQMLQQLSKPFLNWAGRAERHQIEIPTAPLFVHERHSTKAILDGIRHRKARGQTLDLFGDPGLDIRENLEAYEHKGPWQNRMILGDSLSVMNSLLEYEGMAGQVQMIYFDPPYGVKFGSNFQPFVRKRDVSDGVDAEFTREPEMVKAYRDTWELGLHSYLTYLRDRLIVARDLLSESGSIFIQINDKNLHLVRCVGDEVFGDKNFVTSIVIQKTSSEDSNELANVADYVVWYVRDRDRASIHPLYRQKRPGGEGAKQYVWKVSPDLTKLEKLTSEELEDPRRIPEGWRICRNGYPLTSQHYSPTRSKSFEFRGNNYSPGANRQWSVDPDTELPELVKQNRIYTTGKSLNGIMLLEDMPVSPLGNVWTDTGTGSFTGEQLYVVQTAEKAIERCINLVTNPGDLVLDPTCGSGTTAWVSERTGRRWITIDTSRVPLALARQRLLTATFPYFELRDPARGPAGGFVYRARVDQAGRQVGGLVPHRTLSSIARREEPIPILLRDRPEVSTDVVRVTGPFVVEATVAPAQSLSSNEHFEVPGALDVSTHIQRMVELIRQSKVLRLPGNREIVLSGVHRTSDTEYLHAEARDGGRRVAIVFGPADGAISSALVYEAGREAHYLKYDALYFFGFAVEPNARSMIDDEKKLRIPAAYVAVTPDVAMSDLLKTTRASQIFSVTGLPDAQVRRSKRKGPEGQALYEVEFKGLDLFDPESLRTESVRGESVPCWMLDTDYDGLSFYATQVFFPRTSAWDNLQRSLRANFEESVWTHLAGTVSEPFVLGDRRRVAVKVIDERGNELMRVLDVAE